MSRNWSRREVVKAGLVAVGGLATGCAGLPLPAAPRGEGWIDAHVHSWTRPGADYPRVDMGPDAIPLKPQSFTVEVALAHARDHGVRRIVLVQPACYGRDHRYMIDAMAKYPGLVAGIGLIDWRKEARAGLERHKAAGIHGVRIQSLHKQYRNWPEMPQTKELWEKAAELDMSLCILAEPGSFPVLTRLCQRHPETSVVFDHFGWIGDGHFPVQPEVDALCRFSELPKVSVKISRFHDFGTGGAPYTDSVPTANAIVRNFGVDRVMWGSDAPGAVMHGNDYGAALDIARRHMDLTPDDRDAVLRRTAERLFFRS